jgi:hypothetical protein
MPPLIGAWAAWITRGILARPRPLQSGEGFACLQGGCPAAARVRSVRRGLLGQRLRLDDDAD